MNENNAICFASMPILGPLLLKAFYNISVLPNRQLYSSTGTSEVDHAYQRKYIMYLFVHSWHLEYHHMHL